MIIPGRNETYVMDVRTTSGARMVAMLRPDVRAERDGNPVGRVDFYHYNPSVPRTVEHKEMYTGVSIGVPVLLDAAKWATESLTMHGNAEGLEIAGRWMWVVREWVDRIMEDLRK